jgi:hypothetical protein
LNVREAASANSIYPLKHLLGLQPFINLKYKPKL